MIVEEVAPHTDILERDLLEKYLDIFREAHRSTPGGVSVEIGTRAGGTALMFLLALREMYERPPFLLTVDPYGEKPYRAGVVDQTEYVYGDGFYVQAKTLLAPFANHAHFLMRSEDFWSLAQTPLWRDGGTQRIGDLTFVFLDGDHSPPAVVADAAMAMRWLRPGGTVLIDNINWSGDLTAPLKALSLDVTGAERWIALRK